jgi:selenocysteine lyase/cysteine desulfurase
MIDIMSCGGHKGLMAGRGIGCLYIEKRILDTIAVTYAGPPPELRHANVTTELKRSNGARKFNAGGANYLGICAVQAGLGFLNKVSIDTIESHNLRLQNCLIDGLQSIRGVKILSPLTPGESSGIVSFSTPDNIGVARCLEENKIRISSRASGIRAAPHFFNSEEEIDKAVSVVAELIAHTVK